ncbi:hypothetical protein STIUS_v1c03840 [Spiroplasma sp. TIUS-1]|uniref:hypothetical protein n=1 Tax=Spiroplasma sp. TIUS-1 TaxID=216963 RepID=UPI001397BD80|nr:hypothetical protein [Spiroplasma sp. TIUS-1]QHX35938.1 hypothetical protein STIUS_v1c03840 [Spiroplasma sp. TIUS-1]
MTTTDILLICFFSIWFSILIIFGTLAFFKQIIIEKIRKEKETYSNNIVILKPIELDFKLPEGEICYINLKNHPGKILKTKSHIVTSGDKWYMKNVLKYVKSKNIEADIYFTNKNIVIISKKDNYKLKIEEGTIVKPGVKYVNHGLIHELVIKLDETLYFLIQVKDNSVFKTYEAILNK